MDGSMRSRGFNLYHATDEHFAGEATSVPSVTMGDGIDCNSQWSAAFS